MALPPLARSNSPGGLRHVLLVVEEHLHRRLGVFALQLVLRIDDLCASQDDVVLGDFRCTFSEPRNSMK